MGAFKLFFLFTIFVTVVVIPTSSNLLKKKIEEVGTRYLLHQQINPNSEFILDPRANDEEREPQPQVSCDDMNPCPISSLQICQYGSCQCPHPLEQWYWSSRSRCEIDPGRPCDPASPMACYANSMCQPDPTSRTGHRCICFDGLESDGFYCRAAYHRPCTVSSPPYCNYVTGQDCFEGICQCYLEPDQVYDPVKKRCTSRPGFPCSTLEIMYLDCETGSTCVRKENSTEFPLLGVCRQNIA